MNVEKIREVVGMNQELFERAVEAAAKAMYVNGGSPVEGWVNLDDDIKDYWLTCDDVIESVRAVFGVIADHCTARASIEVYELGWNSPLEVLASELSDREQERNRVR